MFCGRLVCVVCAYMCVWMRDRYKMTWTCVGGRIVKSLAILPEEGIFILKHDVGEKRLEICKENMGA